MIHDRVPIEVVRIPIPPPDDAEVAGLLIGTWQPDADSDETASGCLAVVRDG